MGTVSLMLVGRLKLAHRLLTDIPKHKALEEVLTQAHVHLHQYPIFVSKLLCQHKLYLSECMVKVRQELEMLESAIFGDVASVFVMCQPTVDCHHAEFHVKVEKIADKIVTTIMRHGPTNESSEIQNMHRAAEVGNEVETCQMARKEIHSTIEQMWDVRAAVAQVFDLDEAAVKRMEIPDTEGEN